MQTLADVQALRDLGVRYIHAVNQGVKDLERSDAMVTFQIALEANASREFCTRLSRRITSTRRDRATHGKRTGGPVPYGMAPNGYEERDNGKRTVATSLKPGEPAKVAVVREIFDRFGDRLESLNAIAGVLNNRRVPGPTGGKWYAKAIGFLIRQRAYRGDFSFNNERYGQFFGIDSKGEVREKADLEGPGKVFLKAGVYEPIVDPDLFDRANRRLDGMAKDRSIRKRAGYALTGVLVCGHCGRSLVGIRKNRPGERGRSPTVYRCNTPVALGNRSCKQYQVREDRILPFVLTTLRREIDDLLRLTSDPPQHLLGKKAGDTKRPEPCRTDEERWERLRGLLETNERRDEERSRLEGRRGQLTEQIERAISTRMGTTDPRTRREYDRMISGWRDEMERIDSDLAAGTQDERLTFDDLEALRAWYWEYFDSAVQIPTGYHFDDPDSAGREDGKAGLRGPAKG